MIKNKILFSKENYKKASANSNVEGLDFKKIQDSINAPDAENNLKKAKLYPQILSAFFDYKNATVGIGQKSNSNLFYAIELQKGTDTYVGIIEKQNSLEIKAIKTAIISEDQMYHAYNFDTDGGAFLVLCIMVSEILVNNITLKMALEMFKKNNQDYEAVAKMSSSLYYTLIGRNYKAAIVNNNQPLVLPKKSIKDKRFIISNLASKEKSLSDVKIFKTDFRFADDIEENEEFSYGTHVDNVNNEPVQLTGNNFEYMIPEIPSWYIAPKILTTICKLITKSTNMERPIRNFLFRGPSSTGKSSLSKAIAAKLKKPYTFITCNSDTESYDFLGQPMYDSEGKVKFVESPFISAIKNGWVVEIQEPYTIAKQGVLTALNGLLDDTKGITLSTGEFVKRHPDTVVIMTTNVDYEGCRMPNQSVLARQQNVFDIDMPSKAEIKKRVASVTHFNNDKLLNNMIDLMYQINRSLEADDIVDGVCTVREIIDWAMNCIILGDVMEAAESTVISKSTVEKAKQAEIAQLISTKLEGAEYE